MRLSPMQRLLTGWLERYRRRGGGRELYRVECNFEPGCSDYARQAIIMHGVPRGLKLTACRLWRCRRRDLVGRLADPVPPREEDH